MITGNRSGWLNSNGLEMYMKQIYYYLQFIILLDAQDIDFHSVEKTGKLD